jgi:hypothetical protein
LTREAKWTSDPETQKQSIEELGSHGKEAIPALEEVRTITAQDDIRKEVETVIRDITREGEKNRAAQPKTRNQKKPSRGMAKKSSKSGAKKPSKVSNKRSTSTRKTGKKKSTPKGMGKRQ